MKTFYQTKDHIIAMGLATIGVPWAKDDNGVEVRYINTYSVNQIRNLGCYRGWDIQEAAKHAHSRGITGRIVYQFERTPDLEKFLTAYHKHARSLAEGNNPGLTISPNADVIGVILAQLTKNRRDSKAEWIKAPAYIEFMGDISLDSDNSNSEKQTMIGSFKLLPLNATEQQRKDLGL